MSEETPEPQAPEPQQSETADVPPSDGYPEVGQYGYPESMKWRDMRPEHQVAYWQRQSKQNESRSKANEAKARELEERAAQWDALEESTKSETERERDKLRAELEAERQARASERRAAYEQIAYAQLDGAAASKGLAPEQLRLLAGDVSRFFGDEGLDRDAIDAFLEAVPSVRAKDAAPLTPAALGGGARKAPSSSGLAAGAELYERTRKKRTPAV